MNDIMKFSTVESFLGPSLILCMIFPIENKDHHKQTGSSREKKIKTATKNLFLFDLAFCDINTQI